jgi:hypothetical protein
MVVRERLPDGNGVAIASVAEGIGFQTPDGFADETGSFGARGSAGRDGRGTSKVFA